MGLLFACSMQVCGSPLTGTKWGKARMVITRAAAREKDIL